MRLSLTVNGARRELDCDPRRTLLRVLREDLGLTGTKYGCGEGECGACTVELDGRVVNACLTPAGRAHGGAISTIEAMPEDEVGRRLLDGLVAAGAVQCGFCTPGFVLSARELLAEDPAPDEARIRHALSGNLCRCTGYASIVEGVERAATGRPAAPRPRVSGGPAFEVEGYARPATLGRGPGAAGGAGLDGAGRRDQSAGPARAPAGGAAPPRPRPAGRAARRPRGGRRAPRSARSPRSPTWRAPRSSSAGRRRWWPRREGWAAPRSRTPPPWAATWPTARRPPTPCRRSSRSAPRWCCDRLAGERTLPVEALSTGPGRTVLAPGELLVEVVLPRREGAGRPVAFFEKVGPRRAMTIAKASVALRGWLDGGRWRGLAIALGAVAPTVVAAPRAAERLMSAPFDRALLLAAAELAAQECAPIDDLRSTAVHRRRLVRGLLVRNLWPWLPPGEADGPRAGAGA